MSYQNTQHGFTLVEMMLVVSIIALVVVMTTGSFSQQAQEAVVDNSYATVFSAIQSTRNRSIHGVSDTNHGIYIEPHTIILFEGDTYNNTGRRIAIPPTVSLNTQVQEILFERISGTTGQTDDIVLTLTNNHNATKTITISPHGYVY